MLTDISLLLALILLNGVFAMSEMAIVSARRARLLQLADEGHSGASRALALASEPTRFLSTVQVGITSIGILLGAIGEAAIATPVRMALEQFPLLAPRAQAISLAIMVISVTYVSLILGELVPKRLALTRPERIAAIIARPMELLARVARPLVYLLSVSTDTVLRLLGVRKVSGPAVTLEEFKVLIEQGAAEGVLEQSEQELVTNVLNLDERPVGGIMTPRSDIVYLEMSKPLEGNLDTLRNSPHSVLPLCDGGLDHVVGFVRAKHVLERVLRQGPLDLATIAEPPLFVPQTMTLMRLLEQFKRMHLPIALAVDEHGVVDGLVSLADVVGAIVGDLPGEPGEAPMIVEREDGSWLMDGALDIETVKRKLDADDLLDDEDRRYYHTLGGLAMLALGRIPRDGDTFVRDGFKFEVVDMDGNRVDRLLVSRIPAK